MSKKVPIVAIVGRANVGKSSLFNAVLKRREAIVAYEPGTTRDSITAKASYKGSDFWIVDTAGLKSADDEFEATIQEQISEAAASADLIFVVVEATTQITEEDRRVAKLALKSKKPVALLVNKIDQAMRAKLDYFERLGIKQIFHTSATQNMGLEAMLDFVVKNLPPTTIKVADDRVKIAVVGRPNAGKSSLFNTLAKKQQAIVADRAGTTRDVNRALIRYQNREMELLDTAGIRKNGKVEVGIEKFSVLRALAAIEESDVCLLVIDAHELGVQLDQKIAGLVKEAGKGLIIVVSKWDSLEKDPYTRDQLAKEIQRDFVFVPWAPLIFTSAVTGQNVSKLFEMVLEIMQARSIKIKTSQLNTWLRHQADAHPPAGLKNSRPKLNYMTQIQEESTPTFKFFGAHTELLHWSYKRYLEREMREEFGFEGTPINFIFLEKHIDRKKSEGLNWKKSLRPDQLPKNKVKRYKR